MSARMADNVCQCEALREICHGDEKLAMAAVDAFSTLFRDVINEFKESAGRIPTKDELIWVCSENLNRNIREIL